MSTKPNHRRGHGRIRQVTCSCSMCRDHAATPARHKQRRADMDAREQMRYHDDVGVEQSGSSSAS